MTSRIFLTLAAIGFPLMATAQDMPLSQVLIDGEEWQLVADGFRFTEGPAVDAHGSVFFTDPPNGRIYRIDTDGNVSLFAEGTERTSGLMFGPDGLLYGCSRGRGEIVAWNTGDGTRQTIASVPDCNDLVVASTGEIWFTDPSGKQVHHISAEGNVRVVADGFQPNGIILWPDESSLVVTDRDHPHLWTYRVEKDGSLTFPERYYLPLQIPGGKDRPGSDGMSVDTKFRLYVATFAGIQMFDPTGRLGGTIARPQRKFLSNVCFGGKDLNWLYATCSDRVYRRRVKSTGAPYSSDSEPKPPR